MTYLQCYLLLMRVGPTDDILAMLSTNDEGIADIIAMLSTADGVLMTY